MREGPKKGPLLSPTPAPGFCVSSRASYFSQHRPNEELARRLTHMETCASRNREPIHVTVEEPYLESVILYM